MKKIKSFNSFNEASKYLKHAAFSTALKKSGETNSESEKNRLFRKADKFSSHVNPSVKKQIIKFFNKFIDVVDESRIYIKKRLYNNIDYKHDNENDPKAYFYALEVKFFTSDKNEEYSFSIDSKGNEYKSDNIKHKLRSNTGMDKQFSILLNNIKKEELIPYLE